MQEKEVELIIGGLLHDIGKVIYRTGDNRNHSECGYDFLKNENKIENREILNSVRYHHKNLLINAKIENDSNAYITYIADNIAAAGDRRKKSADDYGFLKTMPLSSVFNILNENNQNYTYSPEMFDVSKGINYPKEVNTSFEKGFYASVTSNIKENISNMKISEDYINSLLEVIEATCTYIPSSTNKEELSDISLFDHLKMTAAISTCIFQYLENRNIHDYREVLLKNEKDFYNNKAFCIYSMDMSGIQKFIYTITSKDALKTLRSRSFYLELMMEYLIDELLERAELSRANLMYSGGGHCYIIMPNTDNIKELLSTYEKYINNWLKEKFDISLYLATGYCECSADDLQNLPEGSYENIYKNISEMIGNKKLQRYSADDILMFNSRSSDNYERECCVCRRIGKVDKNGECSICKSIKSLSKNILYSDFFIVTKSKREDSLELPYDRYLSACDEKNAVNIIKENDNCVRVYSVNKMYNGRNIAKNLWIGNYTTGKTFEELAYNSKGIRRLAVYRADVDNLGQAFVAGFKQENGKFETISRTATLSRQLSVFFKQHINYMLENPEFSITGDVPKRNITIVYSGGDDLFVVGAWNDVIEFAVDLRNNFDKYSQGTLSLSGGIGLYKSNYPVSVMAKEVENLEDFSKKNKVIDSQNKICEKNSITLFDESMCFNWHDFEKNVLCEKYRLISRFFEANSGYGKNFLYNLLNLIINSKDKINFARYVYILSRMEPDRKAGEDIWNMYHNFSEKMYEWIKNDKDKNELIAAIYLYVYITRQEDDKNDNQ